MKSSKRLKQGRRRINQHPHPDLVDPMAVTRFWSLVDQSEGCWEWTGDKDSYGYGLFVWNGTQCGAHSLALSFTTGEKRAPGLDTCHSCDNPGCCNPDHLRFDTRLSNVRDMHDRGRSVSPSARLTPEQVIAMRVRRDNGAPQKELAQDFDLSEAYVSQIVRGVTWKDIGGPIQKKNNMYRRNAG